VKVVGYNRIAIQRTSEVFKMKVSALFLFLALAACNSKQVIDDAQCSEEEQDMFLTCIESGCSATYSQDLSGTDACAIEGGGSVVSVEAGGECGFTASGACYVICDCPEGVSISADISGEDSVEAQPDDQNVTNQLLLDRIQSLETSIENLIIENRSCQEDLISMSSEISSIRSNLDSYYADLDSRISEVSEELNDFYISNDEEINSLYELYGEQNLIVSQYDVMCYSGDTPLSGYPLRSPTDSTYSSFYTEDWGCIIANVDVNDLPYHFEWSTVSDKSLIYPEYSRADSFARYGSDRPERYHSHVNWGNDLRYSVYNRTDYEYLTGSGDVVVTGPFRQEDSTVVGSYSVIDIPVRVTIIHDRSYTAP
jgi:hypothetical protein